MTEQAHLANKVMHIYRELKRQFPHIKFSIEDEPNGNWNIIVGDFTFWMESPEFSRFLKKISQEMSMKENARISFVPGEITE
jgi:hypothetical protein